MSTLSVDKSGALHLAGIQGEGLELVLHVLHDTGKSTVLGSTRNVLILEPALRAIAEHTGCACDPEFEKESTTTLLALARGVIASLEARVKVAERDAAKAAAEAPQPRKVTVREAPQPRKVTVRQVLRDKQGLIVGTIEETVDAPAKPAGAAARG